MFINFDHFYLRVDAFVQIGKKIGKSNWDFKVDPRIGYGNWSIPNPLKGFESLVTFNCPLAVNNTQAILLACNVKLLYVYGFSFFIYDSATFYLL